MHIVTTRYNGPTDTRGSRIVASAEGRRYSRPYHHEEDSDQNHQRAAELLAERLGFGPLAGIDPSPKTGYRYIFE